MAQSPDTPLVQFAKTVEQFPQALALTTLSLCNALLSDSLIMCLAAGAIALGFWVNALVAVVAFFFLYVICRLITQVAAAITQVATAATILGHRLQSQQPFSSIAPVPVDTLPSVPVNEEEAIV